MWLGHPPEPSPSCHNSWQLLQSFEDIPLCSILQQIQEKHNLQTVKKVRVSPGRAAALGGGSWGPSHGCLNPFVGDEETCSFCEPVWGASPLSVRQAGEGKSFGGTGLCGLAGECWVTVAHPAHTLYPFCGHQDSEALMKSVKLLQALAQYYNHLQEQPQKALVDILSEVRVYGVWDLA